MHIFCGKRYHVFIHERMYERLFRCSFRSLAIEEVEEVVEETDHEELEHFTEARTQNFTIKEK